MPSRRKKAASSKKPAAASNAGGRGKGGSGGNNDAIAERLMKQVNQYAGANAGSSSSTTQQQFKGPSDAERQFPKLTDEQVNRFLADDGTFVDDAAAPTASATTSAMANASEGDNAAEDLAATLDRGDDGEVKGDEGDDDDLDGEMPEPAPMDDVFGGGGGGVGGGASAAGNGGLLGRLLDPDAGGKGRNRDGTGGLIAPPKPSGNSRQRLRAKIRAMREQRSPLNEQTTVRDANGRKLPGRMLSPEAVQAGIRPPKNTQIDQTLTAQKRKEIFESMKANMNQKREAQLAGIGAAPSVLSSAGGGPQIVDDDTADIGV